MVRKYLYSGRGANALRLSALPYLCALAVILLAHFATFGAALVGVGDGQVVTKTVPLQVADPASGATGTVASLEFLINGTRVSPVITTTPVTYAWGTTAIFDGPATVQALARDSGGTIIWQSPSVHVTVQNHPGNTIQLNSPDVSKTLSGTVKISISSNTPFVSSDLAIFQQQSRPISQTILGTMVVIDGRVLKTFFSGNQCTFNLDTTTLSNGRHYFFASTWTYHLPASPVAQMAFPFTVDNGHATRAVMPKFREVWLSPGTSATLSLKQCYTDGSVLAYQGPATYASGNPAIASVDGAGVVTGGKIGITNITISASGTAMIVPVLVYSQNRGFPHFGKDGSIQTNYDPNVSMFTRSMFGSGDMPYDQAVGAALNTVEVGPIENPNDGGNWRTTTLSKWETTGGGARLGRYVALTRASSLCMLTTFDDFIRSSNEQEFIVNCPWAPDAVKFTCSKLKASGNTIGVETVDEVPWGPTPTPTVAWRKDLPANTITKFMSWINAVPGRPWISWPVDGCGSLVKFQNWQTVSDFSTVYWSTHCFSSSAYPNTTTLADDVLWMEDRLNAVRQFVIKDRPSLLETIVAGESLTSPHLPPSDVAGQAIYSVISGYAGFRAYTYSGLQGRNSDNFQALASANHLLEVLQPHILQPNVSPPNLSPDIITGAKIGPNGNALIALNTSSADQYVNVPLTSFSQGGIVMRYRLTGASLRADCLDKIVQDSVTFGPNEAIVWVCYPLGQRSLPSVALSLPLADTQVLSSITPSVTVKNTGTVTLCIDGAMVRQYNPANSSAPALSMAGVATNTWHRLSAVASNNDGSSEASVAFFVTGIAGAQPLPVISPSQAVQNLLAHQVTPATAPSPAPVNRSTLTGLFTQRFRQATGSTTAP
jgi:hypothetical protein